MCDASICTYKTYQHDAKYLFELYSMTLQTFKNSDRHGGILAYI
jgi:hypothetical protein